MGLAAHILAAGSRVGPLDVEVQDSRVKKLPKGQGKAAANEPLAENAAGLPPAQTTGASAFLP